MSWRTRKDGEFSMKIVVASGKGGVGKSMLVSCLALLFSKKRKIVACDCDVDNPTLGLWLGITEYDKIEKISTSEKAFIDQRKCIKCGKCYEVCPSGAIAKKNGKYEVIPFLCEGCGVCKIVCPTNAVELSPVKNGEIRINTSKYNFPLISGKLYVGEMNSGKIVEELKRRAEQFEYEIAIFDAAAGIGCPVIASIRGSDFAVLVTEPTPTGFSDLQRIFKLINHFGIPYAVVVNKWDLNPEISKKIEEWAGELLLGKISYDRKVIESLVNLRPVLYSDSKVVEEIEKIFENLLDRLKELHS